MKDNSPEAHIFVLIHKMDLVREDLRELILRDKEAEIKKKSLGMNLTVFGTSIWDESLYKVGYTCEIKFLNYLFFIYFYILINQGLVINCLLIDS